MKENIILETKQLVKKYGSFTALNNVNVSVRRGDIYGLIGDNGAGKTTLFRLLTGQSCADSGEIRLFGEHARRELEVQRQRTGAIVEHPGFYPNLTVEKNLEYYRIQKGIPGQTSISALLETVGLDHARNKRCRTLSMGMKQRLGLAIVLLGSPEVLLLDEPITGLDPGGIIEIRNLLLNLNKEKKMTIIISSHILSELEQLSTTYAFLSRGKLLEQIKAEDLNSRCADYIDIAVSDPPRYTALLEKQLHHSGFQVLPDSTIRIARPKLGIEAYSALASAQNMDIYKLERWQMSLEQYYMDLKRKGAA